jgi:hypothetical protein
MEFVWSDDDSLVPVFGQPDQRRIATPDEIAAINDETYRHADRQVIYEWATTVFPE